LTLPDTVTWLHRFHVTCWLRTAARWQAHTHTWSNHSALSTVSSNATVVVDWMLWGGTAGWRVRRSNTFKGKNFVLETSIPAVGPNKIGTGCFFQ